MNRSFTCVLCDRRFEYAGDHFPAVEWLHHFQSVHLCVPANIAGALYAYRYDKLNLERHCAYCGAYCGFHRYDEPSEGLPRIAEHIQEIIDHHGGDIQAALSDHFMPAAIRVGMGGLPMEFGELTTLVNRDPNNPDCGPPF